MTGTRLAALGFVLVLGAVACGSDDSTPPAGGDASVGGRGGTLGVGGGSAAGGTTGVGGAKVGTGGTTAQPDGGTGGNAGGATPVDAGTGGADAAGDANTPTDSAADATQSSDSAVDSGRDGSSGDAGACNTVNNNAQQITEQWAAGSWPVPQGGTIQNGTYYATAAEIYESGHDAGSNGDVKRQTVVVSGVGTSTIHVDVVGYDNDGVEDRSSGTLEYVTADGASPTYMRLVASCPAGDSRVTGYTVQGNNLYLLMNGGGEKSRLTLTRQ